MSKTSKLKQPAPVRVQPVVMRLRNQLRARKAELDGADGVIKTLKRRNKALTEALKDCISTYGPADQVLVTAERQEAWIAVLEANGA